MSEERRDEDIEQEDALMTLQSHPDIPAQLKEDIDMVIDAIQELKANHDYYCTFCSNGYPIELCRDKWIRDNEPMESFKRIMRRVQF